jgi:hypothetical protein
MFHWRYRLPHGEPGGYGLSSIPMDGGNISQKGSLAKKNPFEFKYSEGIDRGKKEGASRPLLGLCSGV